MGAEGKQESNVSDELNKLGKQFSDVIRTTWESEDRKRIQGEIIEGLQRFGDEITDALHKVAESDSGKQAAKQAEKVVTDVKESSVTEDLRKGLLQGLDALNRELSKLSEKLDKEAEVKAEKTPEPPDTQA